MTWIEATDPDILVLAWKAALAPDGKTVKVFSLFGDAIDVPRETFDQAAELTERDVVLDQLIRR